MIHKRMDGKLFAAMVIICSCLYGAYMAHEKIYKATPEYSMNALRQAAEQSNTELLTQQIDTDEIVYDIYNGFVQFRNNQSNASSLTAWTWLPLQNELSTSLKICLNQELTQEPATEATEHAQATIAAYLKGIGIPVPATGWSLVSASWSRRIDDSHAEMTLYMSHPLLQQKIPCTIIWERTAPKEWRIAGLSDAQHIIQCIQTAYIQALHTENEPIRKQIASIVEIQHVTSQLVRSADGTQVFLRMEYTPVFHKQRHDILEIKGIYELRRQTDHELLFTAPVRLSLTTNKTTRMNQFPLYAHIPAQKELARRDSLAETDSVLHITSVTLRDGTTYTEQTALSP